MGGVSIKNEAIATLQAREKRLVACRKDYENEIAKIVARKAECEQEIFLIMAGEASLRAALLVLDTEAGRALTGEDGESWERIPLEAVRKAGTLEELANMKF
jgi:hypothetical protein